MLDSRVFLWSMEWYAAIDAPARNYVVHICSAPANMYDFSFLAPCPSSGLFLSGDQDDIVPADSIETLVGKLRQQRGIEIDHKTIKGANHFFHRRLEQLETVIGDYLDTSMIKYSETQVIVD